MGFETEIAAVELNAVCNDFLEALKQKGLRLKPGGAPAESMSDLIRLSKKLITVAGIIEIPEAEEEAVQLRKKLEALKTSIKKDEILMKLQFLQKNIDA